MMPTARHKDIFPPGFDKEITGSRRFARSSAYIFQSEQLYNSIITGHGRGSTSLADTIIVISAWYGKRTKSKLAHEFLLFEVKDTANEQHQNYIILDRNTSDKPSTATRTSSSQSCSPAHQADDRFRVSYDGVLSKLLTECSFKSCQLLEKLEFPTDTPFYLYELVILADVVSGLHPDYSVVDSNCYLYAGLVWECLLRSYPAARHETDNSDRRGRCVFVRYTPDKTANEEALNEFQERLKDAKLRIDGTRQLGGDPTLSDATTIEE